MDSRKTHPWLGVNVVGSATVQTGPGMLHTIIVNSAANAATIAIYDGVDAGGTLRGTITATGQVGLSLLYDMEFTTGLFIAIAVAAVDLTVTYI